MTDARAVFDYYISKNMIKHRHFAAFRDKILTRLKSYSIAELKQAIDHLAASDWHRRNGHVQLHQVVRSDERVEYWLARKPNTRIYREEGRAKREPDLKV